MAGRDGTCRSSRRSRPSLIWLSGRRRFSAPNSAAEMLLCDTGVLLAAGNVKDQASRFVSSVYWSFEFDPSLPQPTRLCYARRCLLSKLVPFIAKHLDRKALLKLQNNAEFGCVKTAVAAQRKEPD